MDAAEEYAKNAAEEYEKAGARAVESYEEGVGNKQDSLFDKMRGVSKLAVDAARDESDTSSIGENMVEGINNGVEKKSPSLFSKLRSLMKRGISAAQDEAEIHSPSRAFAKKVGAFIPSGIAKGMINTAVGCLSMCDWFCIAKGIEDNEEDATEPIEKIVDKMVLAGSGSVNTNNYIHNPAPTINASFSSTAIIDKINQLIDAVTRKEDSKIYLNGDVLVGELAPAMDAALGDISTASRRGQ